jgi:tRNA threonylcarbamoyladenosine biosynthesis protein TsaB
MPAILALDTSADACSVALKRDAELVEEFALAPREHTHRILHMVDSVLARAELGLAQLDALAFGRGPGSFTGLRIAAGVTQGLALGADLPVVPVSSLAAMAQGWLRENAGVERPLLVQVAVDARMDEVYFGAWCARDSGLEQVATEVVTGPERLQLPATPLPTVAVGSGWRFGDRIAGFEPAGCLAVEPERQVSATDVALLAESALAAGQVCNAAEAQPVYLRDEVSWQKTGRPAQ